MRRYLLTKRLLSVLYRIFLVRRFVPRRARRLREGFNFDSCIARTRFSAFKDVLTGMSITEYYGVYISHY